MNKEKLKTIFWDYNISHSAEEIYRFLVGRREIVELNRNQVIARMLVSFRWYDMIDIFGVKQLYYFLHDDILTFIGKKSVKNRYKNVRETLQVLL